MSDDADSEGAGRRSPSKDGEAVADVPVLRRVATETDGLLTIETSDATAWCPYEGTADYYEVTLEYCPDEYVVELMSYRDYMQTFRDREIGHEEFAAEVYDDLLTLLDPEWLRLTVEAPPRYGLELTLRHQTGPKPASLQDAATVTQ
ncbi:hypothetical protein [Halostella salina]|uniref:hypothetical protein n=1 Tax=Halostella salina TaxID=1547897 RepID=UPI000EF75C98|nr:hypothetical protein [Halostella salina]